MLRRSFLLSGLAAMSGLPFHGPALAERDDLTPRDLLDLQFRQVMDRIATDDALSESVRRGREPQTIDRASIRSLYDALAPVEIPNPAWHPPQPGEAELARPPKTITVSKRLVSDKAIQLIIFSEVTSSGNYNRKLLHPIWPEGDSGVTIGIGYDLGYVDPKTFRREWKAYLGEAEMARLSKVCGIKGAPAQAAVTKVQEVLIPWEKAHPQFLDVLLRLYTALTESAYPNCDDLNADCLGALVSLTFNRGSASHPDARGKVESRREIRNIKRHMREREFARIPDELRSMKRLWGGPKDRGLLDRRDAEAALFEIGLSSRTS